MSETTPDIASAMPAAVLHESLSLPKSTASAAAKTGMVAPSKDTEKGVVHLSPRRKSVWLSAMPRTLKPASRR